MQYGLIEGVVTSKGHTRDGKWGLVRVEVDLDGVAWNWRVKVDRKEVGAVKVGERVRMRGHMRTALKVRRDGKGGRIQHEMMADGVKVVDGSDESGVGRQLAGAAAG